MIQTQAYIVKLVSGETTSITVLNANDKEYSYSFHTLIMLGPTDETVKIKINNLEMDLCGGFILNQIPLIEIQCVNGLGLILVGQKTRRNLFDL